MTQQKKILILGGSSVIGSNLIHYLYDKYRIFTTYNQTVLRLPEVVSLPLDLLNRESVEKFIHVIKPDIVIYAANRWGLTYCQENVKLSDTLNNGIPVALSYICERRKMKLIYLSSCFVFSGETGRYKERDNPRPINVMANSFVSAEYSIQKNSTNYLVLRIPPLIGRSLSSKKNSLLEFVENRLFLRKNISLDDRLITGYLVAPLLGKILHICIENDIKNRILHVSSPDFMTRLSLGKEIAKRLDYPLESLSGRNQEIPVDESKAQFIKTKYNFSLESFAAAEVLGNKIPNISEQLDNFYQLL